MSLRQKVSSAIRILRWDRDVSARASHLVEVFNFQAGSGNVSDSTFSERKNMSTKTSFKRIAAVAAVALALGGFSAVSANAAAAHTSATLLSGTTVSGGSGSATLGTQVVGGIATVVLTETSTTGTPGDILGTLSTSGVGSIYNVANNSHVGAYALGSANTAATYPATAVSVEANQAGGSSGETLTVTVSSTVAGVQTISFTPIGATGAPGTAITALITWGSAPVVSAQYSTAFIGNGDQTSVAANATTGLTTSATAPATTSSTNRVASITVTTNSASGVPITGVPLTVSTSGAGTVAIGLIHTAPTTAAGTNVTSSATSNVGVSTYEIGLWADGRSGVSTAHHALHCRTPADKGAGGDLRGCHADAGGGRTVAKGLGFLAHRGCRARRGRDHRGDQRRVEML